MRCKLEKKCICAWCRTHSSWNKKPGEEIPKAEEECHDNGSNLVAWSERNEHHSIGCEVEEAHADVVVEPEEAISFPVESNHEVEQKAVNEGLD